MNQHFCYYCMSPVNTDGTCPVCGLTAGTYQPAPHHIPPGTILLNRYLFGRVLGEGGFGITYIACDLRLDLKVAIKEYFPTDRASRHSSVSLDVNSYSGTAASNFESSKRKFLAEARTMAKMEKQPEVVGVRDFFELNNTAYIVMEYVDGTNFRELVKQHGGRIPAQHLLSIIEPLFDALSAVHATGLVHRDISPDNLMLEHGKVRLLDFGCARESANGNDTLTIALKHGFAPIEQYTNHGQGPWTDIYALAGTIYFCITGKSPIRSTDRLLGDELILPHKLGIELTRQQEQALLRALAIQPRRRFQTMEEFHAALYAPEPEPEPEPEPDPIPEPIPEPTPEPIPDPTPEPEPEPIPEPPVPAPRNDKGKKSQRWIPLLAGLIVAVPLALAMYPALSGNTSNVSVFSTENRITGSCGVMTKWSLNLDTGVMTISGDAMDDYAAGEAPWYDHRDSITSVIIEDGVTSVGARSFRDCPNLTSVTLADSVTQIQAGAFDHSGLTHVTLPEGLQSIGDDAFSGTLLHEVVFPASLVEVGAGAFEHCPNLRSAHFQGNKARLTYGSGLRDLVFSDENGTIREGFVLKGYTCSAVEAYARIYGYEFQEVGTGEWESQGECGKNIQYYLDYESRTLLLEGTGKMWDFNGTWMNDADDKDDVWVANRELPPWTDWKEAIYHVAMSDGITTISENAFENCINLRDIHWSNTLESIADQSFLCSALVEIKFPDSLTSIHPHAFNFSESLQKVILPTNMKKLEEAAFNACSDLREIYVGMDTILYDSGSTTPFNSNFEPGMPANLTIYSLQNSNAEKFAAKQNIPFVIGWDGYSANNEGQCGNDAWWFLDEDRGTLILYGTGETWLYGLSHSDITSWAKDSYEKGEAFTERPEFYAYRENIHHVIILPGLESLNTGLFDNLAYLETVDLGTVVNCFSGFSHCRSLKEMTFPETTEKIGGWLLYRCTSLESVTILNGSKGVEPMIFAGTSKLTSVTFGPKTKILDTAAENLFSGQNYGHVPSDNLVFYVARGSDAERYASQYGIPYVYIS